MKKKYKITLLILSIMIISVVTFGSYAYFVASVFGQSNPNVVIAGKMKLEFTDGPMIFAENIMLGESVTKTFKVKNTGNVETAYDIYFSEVVNTLADKSDMVYYASSPTGCSSVIERELPSTTGLESKIIPACTIEPNQTHEYTLTVTYLNKDENQDDNKGKGFSAKIQINNYKEANLATLIDDTFENYSLARVSQIRSTPNTDISTRTGRIYYVSNDGNDSNDGLSESTPIKTLSKVDQMISNNQITAGSTVLFRDGDTFTGTVTVNKDDILFGSYGDITKGKPLLKRSEIDGAKDGEWVEFKHNIWKYTLNGSDQVFSKSVGQIWAFCNEGNENCYTSMTSIDRKFNYGRLITSPLGTDESAMEDAMEYSKEYMGMIYQMGHPYSSSDTGGALYVVDDGNPGEKYDEIEFAVEGTIINVRTTNFKADNLKIQFGGSSAIGSLSTNNLTITNCEIGFMGGSVSSYDQSTDKRYGNAINVVGSINTTNNLPVTTGFVANNNYIYQNFEGGIGLQASNSNVARMEKVLISNNVLEYSNYNIEYSVHSTATSGDSFNNSYINDFTIENNIMRYAGYGTCENGNSEEYSSHIRTWYENSGSYNRINGTMKISNNMFYKQKAQAYIFRTNGNKFPILSRNRFYGYSTELFGQDSNDTEASNIGFNRMLLYSKYPNNSFDVLDESNAPSNLSGTTGELAWNYDASTYTLSITGTGAMADYAEDNRAPWYQFRDYIANLVIGEDVTYIGKWAFSNLDYLSTIRIDAKSLQDLSVDPSNVNYGNNYTFYEVGKKGPGTTVIFGPNVKRIPRMLFQPAPDYSHHSNNTKVVFEGNNITTIGNYGLSHFNGYGFVIPEGVKTVSGLSIGYGNAKVIILPDSLNQLTHYSVNGNKQMEKLVLGSSMSLIYTFAIGSASSLKTLVIPHVTNPSDIYESTLNTSQLITVYGDESTQEWVNNLKTTYFKNLEYKPLSEYKSTIYSSDNSINAQVGFKDSYTFTTDKNVKVYYAYVDSNNIIHPYSEINVERQGSTYTINDIRSEVYIEFSD